MQRFIFLLSVGFLASTPGQSELIRVPGAKLTKDYAAEGAEYMIAAQGRAAGLAAKTMFAEGGNAIDAAVAASFVISVERPQSTGLGGGGFMLFREGKSGKVYAVDFRERAPLLATKNMFLDSRGGVIPQKSLNGIASVAVPGLIAGLQEIHQRFGKLPWAKLLEPAIQLAEQGFIVYPDLANALEDRQAVLVKNPAARAIFLKEDGAPFKMGERLVQRDLGKSLRILAEKNPRKIFYQGKIAQAILSNSKELGGLLRGEDFASYKVKWREPLHGSFHGFDLYAMPPPSSGGIHVIEILNILEKDPLRELGFLSVQSIHRTAAAMQLAFADRSRYPGDPDFVKVPVKALISKSYAAELRAKINPSHARASKDIQPGNLKSESLETTHFSIMDREGNMVSSTQTINYWFGSGIVVPGTGILLNDEMDDFSAKPGAANIYGAMGEEANAIAPGKTPLSSMSPTLVLKHNVPVMAVGAPGGTRIITCVAQTLLNYLDYGLPIFDSVSAIRIHHQWFPDEIDMDAPGPGSAVVEALQHMGYKTKVEENAVPCRVEAVVKEGLIFRGAADPRDLGIAVGK